jgi:hypothetical protein
LGVLSVALKGLEASPPDPTYLTDDLLFEFHDMKYFSNASTPRRSLSRIGPIVHLPDPGIHSEDKTKVISNGEKEIIRFSLEAHEYLNHVKSDAFLHFQAVVHPDGSKPEDLFVAKEVVSLDLPEVNIKLEEGSRLKLGASSPVVLTLTNPLNETLENCQFHLEGAGMRRASSEPQSLGECHGQADHVKK